MIRAVAIGAACVGMGVASCAAPPTRSARDDATTKSDPQSARRDAGFAACTEREKLGDASTCWMEWIGNNPGLDESAPQMEHARMYLHAAQPSRPALPEPAPFDPFKSPSKPLTLDTGWQKAGVHWPKVTTPDGECANGATWAGRHDDDYVQLAARCGTAAGMLPYTKPIADALKPNERSHVYDVELARGGCYRFLVAADWELKDFDVAIARPDGKVVWTSKLHPSVVLVAEREAVCVDNDRQSLKIAISFTGSTAGGSYAIGIWTRPTSG